MTTAVQHDCFVNVIVGCVVAIIVANLENSSQNLGNFQSQNLGILLFSFYFAKWAGKSFGISCLFLLI